MTDQPKDSINQPIPPNAQGVNSLDPMDPWRNENPKPKRTVNPIIFNIFFNALTILIGTGTIFAGIIYIPYLSGTFFFTILNVENTHWISTWLFGLPMIVGSVAGGVVIAGGLSGLWHANKNAIFRMGYQRGAKRHKPENDEN